MINVEETHQRLVHELEERETRRMKEFVDRKKAGRAAGEEKVPEALKRYREAGIDVDKLEAFHKEQAEGRKKDLDQIKKKYSAGANEAKVIAPEVTRARSLESAIHAGDAKAVVPAWAAVYSSKDPDDKNAGGTGTDIPNPSIVDAWCWAAGAGNGWF